MWKTVKKVKKGSGDTTYKIMAAFDSTPAEEIFSSDAQFSDEEGVFEMDFGGEESETESTEILADDYNSSEEIEETKGVSQSKEKIGVRIPPRQSFLYQAVKLVEGGAYKHANTTLTSLPVDNEEEIPPGDYSFEKDVNLEHPHFASPQDSGKHFKKSILVRRNTMEGLQRAWPLMLMRGIVSLIFGTIILFYPVLSLRLLIIFFAAYVLVWGLFTIFYALRGRKAGWILSAIEGIVGIIIGVAMLTMPTLSAIMVLYVVAVWAVLTGIMQLTIAIKWREQIKNDFWLGLAGILGILFGILIVVYPHDGILAIAWLLGVYTILAGIALVIMAFKLKKSV